jgi:cysteinyl-tRNA synthetase
MELFNSLSRKKENFIPYKAGEVTIYSCGPTVYGRPHIGNFRSFIFADLLRRNFEFFGLKVIHVMNITDVGHLTGDSDDGEDKLANQAKKEGRTAWEIAKFYTEQFHADRDALNILPPTFEPKATEHIKEQIELIQTLEQKGYTYKTADGIYFDTSKLADYGKLTGQKLEDKLAGARVEENSEKKNQSDFALWKFSPTGEKRHMEWPSPWGIGFPGWHIECSAMSEKYLGTPFDIHTGGIDHIPLHHTNEIAQTEAARDHELARFWLHNEFVKIDGGKMSKSLGNIYTLADIEEKGFQPLDFRYLLLQTHYRMPMNFTWSALSSAKNAFTNLKNKVRTLEIGEFADPDYLNYFEEALSDDLNIPSALGVLHKLLSDPAVDSGKKGKTIVEMDNVFGLGLAEIIGIHETVILNPELEAILSARKIAKENKDWASADQLRETLKNMGYEVIDSGTEQKLKKID